MDVIAWHHDLEWTGERDPVPSLSLVLEVLADAGNVREVEVLENCVGRFVAAKSCVGDVDRFLDGASNRRVEWATSVEVGINALVKHGKFL